MSSHYETSITCPDCEKESSFTIWRSINTDMSPGMSEAVRDGSAFEFVCPYCGSKHSVDYGFLYHDMKNRIWIHYAQTDENEAGIFKMISGDDSMIKELLSAGYIIRVVRSRMELREKLFIFDTGLDDRVIEYLKLVFSAYYYDQDPEAQFDEMLLFVTEDGTKELEYLQDGQGVAHVVVDDAIYEETVPILEEKGLPPLRPSFGKIDSSWAQDNLL